MKRLFALCLALALMLSLSACGGKKTLDFKSVKVIETGDIISLGDKKEDIDKILGESTLADRKLGTEIMYTIDGYSKYDYKYNYNSPLIQLSYKDNILVAILVLNKTEQPFEFKDFSFDMKKEDVEKKYDKSNDNNIKFFEFLDKNGGKATKENAEYINELTLSTDKNAPDKIEAYEISSAEFIKLDAKAFQDAINKSLEDLMEKWDQNIEEYEQNEKEIERLERELAELDKN